MRAERCETCKFWDNDSADRYDTWEEDTSASECHRFPPVKGLVLKPKFVTRFALTMNYDWCGEWKATEAKTTREIDTGRLCGACGHEHFEDDQGRIMECPEPECECKLFRPADKKNAKRP